MFSRKEPEHSFYGVAVCFIILGTIIFVYGSVAWLFNIFSADSGFYFPSFKVLGGLIIMALGYIQLELGLLRQK
ncbi:MAG: hypothetical protein M1324_03720 [Patescibacteria group bacterium]|nr:hypothetical protein [Patescibacteria group bacterium]